MEKRSLPESLFILMKTSTLMEEIRTEVTIFNDQYGQLFKPSETVVKYLKLSNLCLLSHQQHFGAII
jgi:hypothetical protein